MYRAYVYRDCAICMYMNLYDILVFIAVTYSDSESAHNTGRIRRGGEDPLAIHTRTLLKLRSAGK